MCLIILLSLLFSVIIASSCRVPQSPWYLFIFRLFHILFLLLLFVFPLIIFVPSLFAASICINCLNVNLLSGFCFLLFKYMGQHISFLCNFYVPFHFDMFFVLFLWLGATIDCLAVDDNKIDHFLVIAFTYFTLSDFELLLMDTNIQNLMKESQSNKNFPSNNLTSSSSGGSRNKNSS